MLPARPQALFLARSSVSTIGLLALWWFVLLSPLLILLRGSVEILGGLAFGVNSGRLVTETAAGDWSFKIPRELVIPNSPEHPGPTKIQSIEFDLARTDAIAFTFSLPLYWAIALAAAPTRRGIRPMVWGTIVVAILETILLLVFVQIAASHIAANLSMSQSHIEEWFLNFGNFLVLDVIPYIAPFLVTISLHRELRCQIFGFGSAEPMLGDGPTASGARVADQRQRSRRQRVRLRPAGRV